MGPSKAIPNILASVTHLSVTSFNKPKLILEDGNLLFHNIPTPHDKAAARIL